jgi:alanyl-tRNA synthetase
LIVDGVTPGNEGRGYVLRRIIRRAVRHGRKLGATEPFFHQLVAPLVQEMGNAYPELAAAEGHIVRVLAQEEDQFARTLDHGMQLLEEAIAQLKGNIISGKTLFTLYDTYGFPVDLTADIARERNLEVDLPGFEEAMEQQRTLARQSSQFKIDLGQTPALDTQTQFMGYEILSTLGQVTQIIVEGQSVDTLREGESGILVLDETAFYAEGGGQVGDTGQLRHEGVVIDITDCQKQGSAYLHVGTVIYGEISVGERVGSFVDGRRRASTARHHSATHLLHAALREILGEHVQQKGSLVTPDRLRFDFSHFEPVSPEQLQAIESLVNDHVLANTSVDIAVMDFDAARERGAVALFGEKYDDEVRVLTMGFDDFSMELCGGTHVQRTGDIGLFRIVSEGAVAAGIRRIEAVAGEAALYYVRQQQAQLNALSQSLRVPADQLSTKLTSVLERQRELERQVSQLQSKLASQAGSDLASSVQSMGGYSVIVAQVDVSEVRALRELVDQLKQKLGSGLVLLGASIDGKAQLAAGVTKDLTAQFKAGDVVNAAAQAMGGKGGGKPDLAMAGGKDPAQIPAALAAAEAWLKHTLGSE